jgi:hypothetical protein
MLMVFPLISTVSGFDPAWSVPAVWIGDFATASRPLNSVRKCLRRPALTGTSLGVGGSVSSRKPFSSAAALTTRP